MIDTNGQVETTDNGVQANSNVSLRAGPRGFVLLEDTVVRKKMLHFDRERAPERESLTRLGTKTPWPREYLHQTVLHEEPSY